MQTKEKARLPPELERLLKDYQSGYLRESEISGAIRQSSKHESSKIFNALGEGLIISFLMIGFLGYKLNNLQPASIPGQNQSQIQAGEIQAIPSKIDSLKVVQAMQRKGFKIRQGLGELNIVYIFNPNYAQTIDAWSDRRLIITFKNNQPVVIHDSPATIKGGKPSWLNPPNPKGYPVIKPGQYSAWAVGYHKGRRALQQVSPIPVMRTKDQGKSWHPDYGIFGINQHRGSGARVRNWSEGCLVSQSGHEEFMKIIYTDPAYAMNKNFKFLTTIIDATELK